MLVFCEQENCHELSMENEREREQERLKLLRESRNIKNTKSLL